MKKLAMVVLGLALLGAALPGPAHPATCTKETWRAIAELYAQAVCYPDQFPDFVAKSRDKYPPGGPWQKCAEQLGQALMNMGTPLADRRETEERAYDVAARAGAPELGGQVADSLAQSSGSPAVMGLYLLVLVQATAQIQAGNVALFVSTDLYQIASQAWRLVAYGMGVEQMERYRKVIYEATVATIADAAGRIVR